MADYLDEFSRAEIAADFTLRDLERFLKAQDSKLVDFGLPQPQDQSSLLQLERSNYLSQYLALTEQYQHNELLLSCEQLDIYNHVLESFYSPPANCRTTCFFIEGQAGRGKSFTASVLINKLRSKGYIVLIVGSTALSVVQYEQGRTAHSAFGIPVTEVVYLPRNQHFKYSETS